MSRLDTWVDNRIIQNIFIWFFLFLILLTAIQSENRVLTAVFAIVLLAPSVYINNLLILPFLRKKAFVFGMLFVLNVLVFTAISVLLICYVAEQICELNMYINFLGIMVLSMVFASALKIARDSFTRRQHEKEAELKLLKGQLNPHFLFNTLNNLYGLSVVKSDKLPALMLKLSDLLRYSLYETRETLVSLEKEISYLENYMSLEKIRLENTTDIQMNKTGNLSSKKIAPMLLIVFVENAFKHLGNSNEKKNHVYVAIEEKNNHLLFRCENSIDNAYLNGNDLEKGNNGIGLQNVKKRLALMYPEKHSLRIHADESSFSVELDLNYSD